MQKLNVLSACSIASSGSSTAARGCVSPFLIFRSTVNATSSIGDRDSAFISADNRASKGVARVLGFAPSVQQVYSAVEALLKPDPA